MFLAEYHPGVVRSLPVFVSMLIASMPVIAQEPDSKALYECRTIRDDAARLACYDGVVYQSQSQSQSRATATTATKATTTTNSAAEPTVAGSPEPAASAPLPAPLDDDIGRETLVGNERDKMSNVRGRVIRCQENARGKYLFYFDNGQIWQQKDNARVRWRDCDFEVTISKDFIGYKLQPDGEAKKIRIGRIQ